MVSTILIDGEDFGEVISSKQDLFIREYKKGLNLFTVIESKYSYEYEEHDNSEQRKREVALMRAYKACDMSYPQTFSTERQRSAVRFAERYTRKEFRGNINDRTDCHEFLKENLENAKYNYVIGVQ